MATLDAVRPAPPSRPIGWPVAGTAADASVANAIGDTPPSDAEAAPALAPKSIDRPASGSASGSAGSGEAPLRSAWSGRSRSSVIGRD